MASFVLGRIRSIKFALQGMFYLLKTEHAVISQLSIGILTLFLGAYFQITKVEWMVHIFLIGFVLAIEGLNTAVEKICNFVHPDFHNQIGTIKDVAAGAVSFAVFTALVIGVILYYPYFMG